MLNRRVLLVAALVALVGANVSWAECDNPATAEGSNASFTIKLVGGAPSYDGDDVTFTYEVCQVGGQNALSHWILVPDIDCYGVDEDGNPYTLADLVKGATLQTWDEETEQWVSEDIVVVVGEDPTTGLDGIKFDDIDATDACHRYTITFDTSKLDVGYTLCAGCIEAATKAGNEDVRSTRRGAPQPGFATILGPVCCLIGECVTETAFGGDTAGGGNAWWFYFDITGEDVQTITAAQNIEIGTVTVESNDDGTKTITIFLFDGWDLQDVEEPVKIQGYDTPPTSRPAAGLFTTYKGDDLVVTVPTYRFYVIHLDVQLCP
jgi:hypothetical protein